MSKEFEFEFILEDDDNEDNMEILFEFEEDLLLDPAIEEDLERLKEIMQEFVVEERYEDAQRIKDKINSVNN